VGTRETHYPTTSIATCNLRLRRRTRNLCSRRTPPKRFLPHKHSLTTDLGGTSDYTYDYATNDALQRHANRPQLTSLRRTLSFESTSSIFYSAPSSPQLVPSHIRSSLSLIRSPRHQSADFRVPGPHKVVSFLDLDGTVHRTNSLVGTHHSDDDDVVSVSSTESFRTAPMYQATTRHRRRNAPAGTSLLRLVGGVNRFVRVMSDAVLFLVQRTVVGPGGWGGTLRRLGWSVTCYVLFLVLVGNARGFGRVLGRWRRGGVLGRLPLGQNEL
jgi:hypothetical protein